MISLWPFSVSAFPLDHTIFLLTPSIQNTSILDVVPSADSHSISTLGKAAAKDFLSLKAGPPYPHPPQYSM